jgi:hypothetical protein
VTASSSSSSSSRWADSVAAGSPREEIRRLSQCGWRLLRLAGLFQVDGQMEAPQVGRGDHHLVDVLGTERGAEFGNLDEGVAGGDKQATVAQGDRQHVMVFLEALGH